MTTVNGQLATLDQILARLDRLEMACGIMAAAISMPRETSELLHEFAEAVVAEHRRRDTAAHIPEPDL